MSEISVIFLGPCYMGDVGDMWRHQHKLKVGDFGDVFVGMCMKMSEIFEGLLHGRIWGYLNSSHSTGLRLHRLMKASWRERKHKHQKDQ